MSLELEPSLTSSFCRNHTDVDGAFMDDQINLKLPKVVLDGMSELRKHDKQDYDSGDFAMI